MTSSKPRDFHDPGAALWRRYGLAVVCVAVVALVRWRLTPIVGATVPFTLFYPAIAAVTWLAGLGPGVLALVLSGVAGTVLFASPPAGGGVRWISEPAYLAIFAFVGVLLMLVVEVARRQGQRAQEAARAARDAEGRWRSLVDNTADAITILDPEGRVVFANRARGGGAAVGQVLAESVPPAQRDDVRRELERVFAHAEPARFEVEVPQAQGAPAWEESRLVPIRDEGGVRGALVISSDVTERRRSLDALRESASRFQALFESSLDATLVADDEGRLVDVNQAACDLLEARREDLLGSGIWQWSPSRAAFDGAWARFLAQGTLRGEWELRPQSGVRRQVEVSARARFAPGRHLSVLRDITERRRGERLSAFLARAAGLLGSSLDERETVRVLAALAAPELADWAGVDLPAPDGRLLRVALASADPARAELYWDLARRFPPDGLRGAVSTQVLRTGEPWLAATLEGAALEGLCEGAEHLRLVKETGLCSALAVPLASRGHVLGVLWLGGTDPRRPLGAAELRVARELADRVGVALENARLYREAQDVNRAKDEFLATLSHELRTPLNAIVGWTHLLRTSALDTSTSQRALETIERNARLQSQLIADILDVSRIVSGKLRLEREPVGLGPLLAAAVDAVRPLAEGKGLQVEAAIPSPGPQVLGDAGRLQQVAQNLLSNAIKFTPAGGCIRTTLRCSGALAEVIVEDDGVGIAPDFLPHVFERFRQFDSSTTRAHGGLGLGLAITRHLVDAHGGSVEAASEGADRGSTFTVRLPVLAGAGAGAPGERAREQARPVELGGVRVLVVDDDALGRQALGTILERAGASVAHASTSNEAFDTLASFRPHVMVSDLGLARGDGFSLVARVRALPPEHGGATPALAVTAHAQAEEMARALRAGFQLHLAKPVDPEELAAAVARLAAGPPLPPSAGD
jgi:PAS domain S-box-containing protein